MPNDVVVQPYVPSHVSCLIPANMNEIDYLQKNIPTYWDDLPTICENHVYSLWRDNCLLAIIGCVETLMGNGEMIFMPSVLLKKKFNKNVMKAFKNILDEAKQSHVRLQADCEDNPIFKRFLEFFGFQYEGTMKCAGWNNQDLLLYALVNHSEKN